MIRTIQKSGGKGGNDMVIRPKNAAKYLDIGLSTFWLYVSQGKIKTIKLSDRVTVVHEDELNRFINQSIPTI